MSKGSKPAGNITQTTTNPLQQAQQPYLTGMWDAAKNLYQNNPMQYYPNQSLATWGEPERILGSQDLYNTGTNLYQGMNPQAQNVFNAATSGQYGGAYNPAMQPYQDFTSGSAWPMQNMLQLQQAAQNAGSQYAQQVGQYSDPMQQQGAQAANVGGQYAQQIGQYSNPIANYANQAGANNNLGLSQLGNTASGAYLNSNPYIQAAIQSAMDPVTRNYQTSIAPTTDAMFSGGGRYGSGAMASAVDTGQQNLVKGLGDISSNMMNANYARERQLQDQAAQQYGSLYNAGLGLGITGLQNAAGLQQAAGNMYLSASDRAQQGLQNAAATQAAAGNQYWQGQSAADRAAQSAMQGSQFGVGGMNNAWNTGNQAALQAMAAYPQLAQGMLTGAKAQTEGGTGLASVEQEKLNDLMKRYYGEQNAPYDTLAKYSGFLGNPLGGTGSSTQPYFQNQFADTLSGLTGAAGLARNLGLGGGLGGLGGAAAAAPGWAAGTGAGSGIFTNLATGATSDLAGIAMPAAAGAGGLGGIGAGLGSLFAKI
jgi:hypothetical protein